MKSFYYFSKSKLKFVEIKNFYQKFFFILVFTSIIISFFLVGGYYIFDEIINADSKISLLKISNKELTEKVAEYKQKFGDQKSQIDDLSNKINDIRLLTNLTPLKDEDYGIGGQAFDNVHYVGSNDLRKAIDEMDKNIANMTVKLSIEKTSFEESKATFENNKKLLEAIPAIMPAEGRLGDSFGMRFHPITKNWKMHNGLDIVNEIGTHVYATGNGVVTVVDYKQGLGLTVEIDHGFGYTTVYGHLSAAKVTKGQKVERGDLIALIGNSGELTTGPHLHYEIWQNGIALNPKNFFYEDLKFFQNATKN